MLPQFSLKLTENCYFKISTVIKGKGFQENPNLTVLRCTRLQHSHFWLCSFCWDSRDATSRELPSPAGQTGTSEGKHGEPEVGCPVSPLGTIMNILHLKNSKFASEFTEVHQQSICSPAKGQQSDKQPCRSEHLGLKKLLIEDEIKDEIEG